MRHFFRFAGYLSVLTMEDKTLNGKNVREDKGIEDEGKGRRKR